MSGPSSTPHDITQLLAEWSEGNQAALDKLYPLVYNELRRIAARELRRERPNHTLQATALVHEVYLKLVDQHRIEWQNRAQFFGVAAQLIRRILVDHVRTRQTAKRGGGALTLTLEDAVSEPARRDIDLVKLDDALLSLATKDEQQSRVVELRFFGGLSKPLSARTRQSMPSRRLRRSATFIGFPYRDLARFAVV